MIVSIAISGCTALNNPFKTETVTITSFCKMDLTKNIELERMSFELPKLVSRIKLCQTGKVMHDITRDHKDFFIQAVYFKNNIYSNLGSMDLRVRGNLNSIGNKLETPEEWLARRKVMWKKAYRDDYPRRRKVKRVKLKGLDCWKIYKTYYFQKYYNGVKLDVKPVLQGRDIKYVCWDPSAKRYPPFTVSAGMGYKNNKPAFSYDLNKDILLPVFDSLKLKKLGNEDMKKRLEVYREKQEANCKSIYISVKRSKRKNEYQYVSDVLLKKMDGCGYETKKLRSWWCEETIKDSKKK